MAKKTDLLQKIIDNARTNPRKSLNLLNHPLIKDDVSPATRAAIDSTIARAVILNQNTETALKRAATIAAQWAMGEKAQEMMK